MRCPFGRLWYGEPDAVSNAVGYAKFFSRAGQPGWAAIIPIVNTYFACKVASRPGWWVILMFIPFVNFIIAIILCIDIAKSFGKGVGFGIGLILLPVIFFPILGFGSAQYQGGATPIMASAPLPPPSPVPLGAPL